MQGRERRHCALPPSEPQTILMQTCLIHTFSVRFQGQAVKWEDGSMQADLPMQRLSELFNVNHFIVSQVNPHGTSDLL